MQSHNLLGIYRPQGKKYHIHSDNTNETRQLDTASHRKSNSQMALHAPLYCTTCSTPCLLPRADIPLPSHLRTPTNSGDTTDSPVVNVPNIATLLAEARDSNWQARWHVFKVTTGLCSVFTVSPSSAPLASLPMIGPELDQDTTTSNEGPPRDARCVPIHEYCLNKVLATTRKSIYNSGFSHEENMMLGWSLPKWTGYGPWVNVADRGGEDFLQRMRGRGWVGYWGGTVSQRERHQDGEEGSHLVSIDHASPLTIAHPKVDSLARGDRPRQTSKLLELPSHVLSQIALELLDNPSFSPESVEKVHLSKTKLVAEVDIINFLSFTRTCSQTRSLDIPSALWRLLTLHSVHHWKLSLLTRWRANPTGVGSASNLWISLDEDFVMPVEKALSDVKYPLTEVNLAGFGTRDVFQWWMYDPGWRSRRRVWHSVVHACATARDADWCAQADEYDG